MDRNLFYQEVYSVVREIPAGNVVTYKQIAFLTGYAQYSRMVGQALAAAPEGAGVPCHRVVNSCGRLAPMWTEQRGLLEAEGVLFKENGCVDMKRCQWKIMEQDSFRVP